MTQGEKIKAAREAAFFNMTSLAREIGVNRVTIHNWETGVTVPQGHYLCRIAKACEVKVEDLL